MDWPRLSVALPRDDNLDRPRIRPRAGAMTNLTGIARNRDTILDGIAPLHSSRLGELPA